MKNEGMAGAIDVDLDDFMSKEFVTFRKTKNYSEVQYATKFHFVNMVNKHWNRNMENITDEVCGLIII